jgi:hypothetical protein
MKIALLILLGLMLGLLGGAALGIAAGIGWVEMFSTAGLEGHSARLVFFTFMPIGAILGAATGAISFAAIATRDVEVAIEGVPARERPWSRYVR